MRILLNVNTHSSHREHLFDPRIGLLSFLP